MTNEEEMIQRLKGRGILIITNDRISAEEIERFKKAWQAQMAGWRDKYPHQCLKCGCDAYNGADWMWFATGRHLKNCSCSTEEAQDMIKGIMEGMTTE